MKNKKAILNLKENFQTATQILAEEIVKEANSSNKINRRVKVLFAVLFLTPLIVQIIGIAYGKPNVGYWMFLPDLLILFFFVCKEKDKKEKNV